MATNAQYYSRMTSWKLQKKAEIMRDLQARQAAGGPNDAILKEQWALLGEETKRLKAMEESLADLYKEGVSGSFDLQQASTSRVDTGLARGMLDYESDLLKDRQRQIDVGRRATDSARSELEGLTLSIVGDRAAAKEQIKEELGRIYQTSVDPRLAGQTPLTRAQADRDFARLAENLIRRSQEHSGSAAAEGWNTDETFVDEALGNFFYGDDWLASDEPGALNAMDSKEDQLAYLQREDIGAQSKAAAERAEEFIQRSGGTPRRAGDMVDAGAQGLDAAFLEQRQKEIDDLRAEIKSRREALAGQGKPTDTMSFAELDREAARIFQELYGTPRGQARARGEEFEPRPIFRKKDPVDPEVEELIARDVAMTAAPEPALTPEPAPAPAPEPAAPSPLDGLVDPAELEGISDEDRQNAELAASQLGPLSPKLAFSLHSKHPEAIEDVLTYLHAIPVSDPDYAPIQNEMREMIDAEVPPTEWLTRLRAITDDVAGKLEAKPKGRLTAKSFAKKHKSDARLKLSAKSKRLLKDKADKLDVLIKSEMSLEDFKENVAKLWMMGEWAELDEDTQTALLEYYSERAKNLKQ
jgi:hypothetical protein